MKNLPECVFVWDLYFKSKWDLEVEETAGQRSAWTDKVCDSVPGSFPIKTMAAKQILEQK